MSTFWWRRRAGASCRSGSATSRTRRRRRTIRNRKNVLSERAVRGHVRDDAAWRRRTGGLGVRRARRGRPSRLRPPSRWSRTASDSASGLGMVSSLSSARRRRGSSVRHASAATGYDAAPRATAACSASQVPRGCRVPSTDERPARPRRRLRRPVRPADRPPRARGEGLQRDRPARRCPSPSCWPREPGGGDPLGRSRQRLRRRRARRSTPRCSTPACPCSASATASRRWPRRSAAR